MVRSHYQHWLETQEAAGQSFTAEQRWWLDQMAEYISVNLTITPDDFDYGEFFNRGGQIGAARVFRDRLPVILSELNTALAA